MSVKERWRWSFRDRARAKEHIGSLSFGAVVISARNTRCEARASVFFVVQLQPAAQRYMILFANWSADRPPGAGVQCVRARGLSNTDSSGVFEAAESL